MNSIARSVKNTNLHIAVAKNDIAEVKRLLKNKNAGLNFRNVIRNTSLHIAARKGYIEIAKLLISNGANINAVNMDGLTPLQPVTQVY